jgi:hypothetical protein
MKDINRPMTPGVTFAAIFGIVIALFVSIWLGALMIAGAVIWHLTHPSRA